MKKGSTRVSYSANCTKKCYDASILMLQMRNNTSYFQLAPTIINKISEKINFQ